jgi:uncharacterized protein (TIGR00251 family)
MSFIKEGPWGFEVKIFVQPRSSRNSVEGPHGDALKIKLKAPPVDGAANKMCIEFLSKLSRVPKSTLEVISGHSSRTKRILFLYADDAASATERTREKRQLESRLFPQKNLLT